MSKKEIEDYRMDILKNSDWSDKELDKVNRKYLDELGLYDNIRFKSDEFAMYDRWCKTSHENDKKGIKDEALAFPVRILEREDGYNLIYYMGLISEIKRVGEFEYIKGIDIIIPDKYKDMFKFN
jgi:hypothetical protein